MTPAINSARHAGIAFQLHEYQHDNAAPSYGKQLAVGIVPVNSQLGLKQIAKAAGAKKAVMAAPEIVERTTGYVLGGVSPLGQKKRLPTFIDTSAQAWSTLYVSAGRRGLEIELSPDDLAALSLGQFAALSA